MQQALMNSEDANHKIEPVKVPEGFDLAKLRADFPILDSEVNGQKLVYLDSGATAQKPVQVIERMREFLLHENATVRRGLYSLSAASTNAFDDARAKVQKFLNAKYPEEIIFTRGTTESINMIAKSFGEAFISEGDEIMISAMEHHANIVPWQMLCERTGAKLKIIPIKDNGELDLEEYKKLIGVNSANDSSRKSEGNISRLISKEAVNVELSQSTGDESKVKLLAITHISNVLGTVNPIKEMIELAHSQGITVLVDGAQATQHGKVDVQELDADFYAFSGHKVYGPTGIGVVYGKKDLLERIPPYHGGGEMIEKVSFAQTKYAPLPFKFEAGTPPIVEAIGLGESLDYIEALGFEKIKAYEQELLRYATAKAKQVEGLKIVGEASNKAGIVSFVFDDIEAFDIGTLINEYGVAMRVGHHCAQPLMERFAVTATARISLAFYNTQDDIDRFFDALAKVLSMLR